jgi:hypothetical protein
MEESKKVLSLRVRFYVALELMLVAWSVTALAVGATLALGPAVLYTLTMVGLLVILGLAMRSGTYRTVRPLKP